ncbi:MAG: PqqD family protein [Ardenticatenaceae bacterium]
MTLFRISSSQVIEETIDNEVMIVDLESGNYYSLDKVGADIWHLIKMNEEASVRELVVSCAERYEGSHVEIENGVSQLVTELQQEKLIVAVQRNGSSAIPNGKMSAHDRSQSEKSPFEVPILHKYTDMQDLLLLDPIHEVDETGWPNPKAPPPKAPKAKAGWW